MADETLIGVGKMAINGQIIENPTTFQISVETEEYTIPNRGTVGGGNYRKFSRPSAVRVVATVHNFLGEVLRTILKGDVTAEASASVTDQAVTAVHGGLTGVDQLIDVDDTVTVSNGAGTWASTTAYALGDFLVDTGRVYECTTAGTSGGTAPTWPTTTGDTVTDGTAEWTDRGAFAAVLDTDYRVWWSGIEVIDGGGIPNGCPLLVSYTTLSHDRLELMTAAAEEFRVDFDGYNEDQDKPMVGMFPIVVWDPQSIDLISDGYGNYQLSGEVLQDSTRPTGRSKFGTLRLGTTAVL
jgi:hypothetical protein